MVVGLADTAIGATVVAHVLQLMFTRLLVVVVVPCDVDELHLFLHGCHRGCLLLLTFDLFICLFIVKRIKIVEHVHFWDSSVSVRSDLILN